MAIVITQEGAVDEWQAVTAQGRYGWSRLHLLGANYTPTHLDTQATLAAQELAVGGYTPQILVPANWTFAYVPDGASASYPPITWNLTAACTIYGWWAAVSGDLSSIVAEALATPWVVPAGGGVFQLSLLLYRVSQPFSMGPCV